MPVSVDDLALRIFAHLRRMDEEAKTVVNLGSPAGLNDYGRHARPDSGRPSAEVEWSRRLAALVSEDGTPTSREVEYPVQRGQRRKQRCDLVATVAGDSTAWIELKGAWRDYWNGGKIYRSYLLHSLLPGLDKTKTHTVPFDLVKLSGLRPPAADFVGELVVGFERPDDPMDDDIATLVSLAGLSDWNTAYDSWMSPTVKGQRVRCWLWHRPSAPPWSVPGIDPNS